MVGNATVGPMQIHGTCDPRFEAVHDAFAANFDQHGDVGASAAVTLDGEMVVDLWAGTIATDAAPFDEHDDDPAERGLTGGSAWERDTIVNVWSTTKTMAALSCLVLADQGELDLDAPIERVWPGFRVEGKGAITPTHVLSHSAGLSGWTEPITVDDLYDHTKVADLLAAQEPWWEPGTRSGYHAITQGYLLGELVRRVTGQTLGEFFAAEIAGPLDADFHIGTGPEHDARVGHVIAPSTGLSADGADPDSIAVRTVSNPRLTADASATVPWRRAEIPAAGGHGNARSVAHIHSVLACEGEAHGVRLLSATGCDRIFQEQTYGEDLVLPGVFRLGVGFGLPCPELPISPNERACFWGGWGGSLAVIDLDARMSVAYVMNKMGEGTTGDLRGAGILLAAHTALAGI
ncbi:MAG: class A beta-lactamase-related serine hydrolase [Ilumatobacter sp.]|nr:MAG: class A beta-lactamase-related serine hydrolase [Ilumatobacter sp.]